MLNPGQMAMRVEIKGATYEPQTPDEHIRGISLLLPVEDRGGFVFLIAYTKKKTPTRKSSCRFSRIRHEDSLNRLGKKPTHNTALNNFLVRSMRPWQSM